jgi:Zn-finger protein
MSPKPEDLSRTTSNPEGGVASMNYKFFTHQECSFYPCHDLEEWKSCLFCWCPLYLLECDGTFTMRSGIKDCSSCVIPHTEEGYDYILEVVKNQVYQRQ